MRNIHITLYDAFTPLIVFIWYALFMFSVVVTYCNSHVMVLVVVAVNGDHNVFISCLNCFSIPCVCSTLVNYLIALVAYAFLGGVARGRLLSWYNILRIVRILISANYTCFHLMISMSVSTYYVSSWHLHGGMLYNVLFWRM